jgi:hypothetical protein
VAPEDLWGRDLSVPVRQAQHVAYSIEMLGALRSKTTHHESTIANACVESFLVHARLLIDFLQVRSEADRRDFSAGDFGALRPPDDDDRVARLRTVWQLASQQVVHLSRGRTPDDPYAVTADDAERTYEAIVQDLLDLLEIFVADVESRGRVEAPLFRGALSMARMHLNVG